MHAESISGYDGGVGVDVVECELRGGKSSLSAGPPASVGGHREDGADIQRDAIIFRGRWGACIPTLSL